jgi:hypothetical protein
MRFGIFHILILTIALMPIVLSCEGIQKGTSVANEEPVILAEGSTSQDDGYTITDTGEVIYRDSRQRLGESDDRHNPDFAPVFPSAQRIFPEDENPGERENYITRAPFNIVEVYYANYLGYGDPNSRSVAEGEDAVHVQTLNMRAPDGHRSTALYLNKESGPRGGLKIFIKDFPDQNGVQIILTTLDASPVGINPFGFFLTPEEAEEMFARMDAEKAEQERIREELESRAANSDDSDSGGGEEQGQGDSGDAGEGD